MSTSSWFSSSRRPPPGRATWKAVGGAGGVTGGGVDVLCGAGVLGGDAKGVLPIELGPEIVLGDVLQQRQREGLAHDTTDAKRVAAMVVLAHANCEAFVPQVEPEALEVLLADAVVDLDMSQLRSEARVDVPVLRQPERAHDAAATTAADVPLARAHLLRRRQAHAYWP